MSPSDVLRLGLSQQDFHVVKVMDLSDVGVNAASCEVNSECARVSGVVVVVLSTAVLKVVPNSDCVPVVKVPHVCSVDADTVARNPSQMAVVVDRHSTSITAEPSIERMMNAEMAASCDSHWSVKVVRMAHVYSSSGAEAPVGLRLHSIEDSIIAAMPIVTAPPAVAGL